MDSTTPIPAQTPQTAKAAPAMAEAFEAIAKGRRSVYVFRPDPVPGDTIAWALEMAALAPNHYRTRPWRFCVFAGGGLARLADAFGEAAGRLGRDPVRTRSKAEASPVVIAACCVPQLAHPKVKIHEEELATAAAIQNLLLALAAAGVGAIWTTGELVDCVEVRRAAGVAGEPDAKVLGLIYVGYRDPESRLPRRDGDNRGMTTWLTD